ncbi:MAG TPA: hypothetical protein VGD06_00880 [Acidobacteriota bacterium]
MRADDYQIDYDNLDVADLVAQIRRRTRQRPSVAEVLPEAIDERVRARVRAAVDLDDQRPYALQQELRLQGSWNVTPEDLIASRRPGGSVLSFIRRLARPVVKLFANLELPLYKQFKINLGIADALDELLRRNAELDQRLDELAGRLEKLEARRPPDGGHGGS